MKIFITGNHNLITIGYDQTINNKSIIKISGMHNKFDFYSNNTIFIKIKGINNLIRIYDNVDYIIDNNGKQNQVEIIKSDIKNKKLKPSNFKVGNNIPDNFNNWTEKELDDYIESNGDIQNDS